MEWGDFRQGKLLSKRLLRAKPECRFQQTALKQSKAGHSPREGPDFTFPRHRLAVQHPTLVPWVLEQVAKRSIFCAPEPQWDGSCGNGSHLEY